MTTRAAPAVAVAPLSSVRAVRQAVTRAADTALGMQITVDDVVLSSVEVDRVTGSVTDADCCIRLERAGRLVGLIGIDPQLRAAAIEIQTMGAVAKNHAPERPHTGTDVMMLQPLITALLAQLVAMPPTDDLQGWADDVQHGVAFDSLRAAELALGDGGYRLMKIEVGLVADKRTGSIVIALPLQDEVAIASVDVTPVAGWDIKMQAAVAQAPATLQAVLTKLSLPLGAVNDMQVGQIIPVFGATVGSVRLFAPGNKLVATARLGQSSGMRAVRIETPPEPALRDMPAAQRTLAAVDD